MRDLRLAKVVVEEEEWCGRERSRQAMVAGSLGTDEEGSGGQAFILRRCLCCCLPFFLLAVSWTPHQVLLMRLPMQKGMLPLCVCVCVAGKAIGLRPFSSQVTLITSPSSFFHPTPLPTIIQSHGRGFALGAGLWPQGTCVWTGQGNCAGRGVGGGRALMIGVLRAERGEACGVGLEGGVAAAVLSSRRCGCLCHGSSSIALLWAGTRRYTLDVAWRGVAWSGAKCWHGRDG